MGSYTHNIIFILEELALNYWADCLCCKMWREGPHFQWIHKPTWKPAGNEDYRLLALRHLRWRSETDANVFLKSYQFSEKKWIQTPVEGVGLNDNPFSLMIRSLRSPVWVFPSTPLPLLLSLKPEHHSLLLSFHSLGQMLPLPSVGTPNPLLRVHLSPHSPPSHWHFGAAS